MATLLKRGWPIRVIEARRRALSRYGNADGYDRYMGGWSAALSPLFIEFAQTADHMRVLDLGCGTGNLLSALRARFPSAQVAGADPSRALLEKARSRPDLAGVEIFEAVVERLPFADGQFDQVLSMLVLQEFAEPAAALAEMRRVTDDGGLVAACQWDFPRMPIIAGVVAALMAVDPGAGHAMMTRSPHHFTSEADMIRVWEAAGLREVKAGRIRVTRTFPGFDDLWLPLLKGTTPSTLALAALSAPKKRAAREVIRQRFDASRSGRIEVTAEALVVRGEA